MSRKEELLARKQKIQSALDDILEGGQEFQTRTGRVKMVSYDSLKRELNEIETELAFMGEGGNAMDELLCVQARGGGKREYR